MINRNLQVAILLAGLFSGFEAHGVLLCQAKNGVVTIKPTCNKSETSINPSELGVTGQQGPIGPQGPVGPQGPIGPKGDQGPQGFQGSIGQMGLKGDQGLTGPKGDPGAAGPIGPQGTKGDSGRNGKSYTDVLAGDSCTALGDTYLNTGLAVDVTDTQGPVDGVSKYIKCVSRSQGRPGPAYSWNLSRDMVRDNIHTNPFGLGNVWTAMYDTVGVTHDPGNYKSLPSYQVLNSIYPEWYHPSIPWINIGFPTIDYAYSAKNVPNIIPDQILSAIVKWTSPIDGRISISGSVSDGEWSCGNGIKWYVDKESSTLITGSFPNGNYGSAFSQQFIPVSVGTAIYFIVDPNGDNYCDWTYFDILITSP